MTTFIKKISFIIFLFAGLQSSAQMTPERIIIEAMQKATVDWNKGDLESYMAF